MGNHGVVSADPRSANSNNDAEKPPVFHVPTSQTLTLRNWPVSWRLIAVIVMALVMGLVFGGLRVSAAVDSAAGFGRVSQLASLGQQVTGLVQGLEDERDATTGVISGGSSSVLKPEYNTTDAAAARVRALAAGIGGSFPANIQATVATVRSEITPSGLGALRSTAQASQDALAVIADYAAPISDMITLNDQIAQGISDPGLVNDVRTLNSLAVTKDEAAQQRAFLYNALTQQFFSDGEQPALTTALSEELVDKAAFETTATPAEQSFFSNTVAGPKVNEAEGIEDLILTSGALDTRPINISLKQAPAEWYSTMSSTVDDMQAVELQVAKNIVARSQTLQQGAEQSARFTAILTAVVLLLVLIATLIVARSLVLPLRRLRAGALDIATVQLPERVRQLAEAPDTSLEVAPIDVPSSDEIGQVARAFDQVHSEAVRLAGNEAMLRSSFNAMFVNLSRRSQSLIERLARTIDSLEQNEEDPDRLSNLFSMDHLVTRMRRNSENLLLLAGHDSARKWSEPVSLADVVRAATSEIEQYSRVALSVQSGVAISGQAVSDVVRLLAEIIENATIFSPRDTQVRVSAQELTSGGVLIEVSDSGVGVSAARLAEMNLRLINPPAIDVSVSSHMGLFAVARLAERHGVRVRLRAGSPQGLTALVWLPDTLTERGARPYGWSQSPAQQGDFQARRTTGRHSLAGRSASDGQPTNGRSGAVAASAYAGVRIRRPSRTPARAPTSARVRARQCGPPTRRRRIGFAAVGWPPRVRAGMAAIHPGPPRRQPAAGHPAQTVGPKAGTPPRSSPNRSGATTRSLGYPCGSRGRTSFPDPRAAGARPTAEYPAVRQMVAGRRPPQRHGRSGHLRWLAAA